MFFIFYIFSSAACGCMYALEWQWQLNEDGCWVLDTPMRFPHFAFQHFCGMLLGASKVNIPAFIGSVSQQIYDF